jgi:phosphomannomutase
LTLIKSISGIRGTLGGRVGETLSPMDITKFAAAYGTWIMSQSGIPKVVIGRDARPSGNMVSPLVVATLQMLGIDVIDLGLSTTPTVELEVSNYQAGGGIIITASHNPANWNALKLLNHKGEFISAQDGQEILELVDNEDFTFAIHNKMGTYQEDNSAIDRHIEHVLGLELVDREAIANKGFRIVVDAVNSTGGIAIPKLLKALGVEVIDELYCEPTGVFGHSPEPIVENLTGICSHLEQGSFDLGIVVDPDVDRLAIICEDGTPFGEEYTLVAVADYVLANKVGNTVSNLSSTRALKNVTQKHGGEYFASAVGEVNVVQKMKEQHAIIGGEGNGGVIYPESHYGRDALVGVALFLSHLAKSGGTCKMLKSKYPNYFISKNKIELTPDIDVDVILEKIQEKYAQYPINTIDGVKIDFEDEWVHLRKSNTEPIIRIYVESSSESTAEHLAKKIMKDISEIIM